MSSSTIDIPGTVLDKVRKFRLTHSKNPELLTAQVFKIDKASLTLALEEELSAIASIEDLVEGTCGRGHRWTADG